jgi:hypothetical protein
MNVCLMEAQLFQMVGPTCSSPDGFGVSSSGSDVPPPTPRTIVEAFMAAQMRVMCQILQTQQQLTLSFLPGAGTSLHALGRGRLHPSNAPGFHSHPLEASLVASSGGARGCADYGAATVARVAGLLVRSILNNCECGGWKTLRVSASIYNPTGDAATARWISIGS